MDFLKKKKKKSKKFIPNSEKTLPISLLLLLEMKFKSVQLIYLLHRAQEPTRFLVFPPTGQATAPSDTNQIESLHSTPYLGVGRRFESIVKYVLKATKCAHGFCFIGLI